MGLDIAEKAVSMLFAKQIPTGTYEGILTPRASADLLGILSESFLSESLYKNKTRLKEKEGTGCFAPVLSLDEAPDHPHNRARGTFAQVDGISQPAPAPRFSVTPAAPCRPVGEAGAETESILRELGLPVDTAAP